MDISHYLEKHADELVEELREFMQQSLPDEVRCIEVIVFRESLPGIPFRVYFLNRFKGSAKTINNFEPLEKLEVLVDSPEYVTREDVICDCLDLDEEDEQENCMNVIEEKYNNENKMIAKWFSECWTLAGGNDYATNAFVVEEDSQFNPINLKTGLHIKHMREYNQVFDG